MKITGGRTVLALLAALPAAAALAELRIIEDAIETTAASVVLPSDPPSSLVVTPCQGCTPVLVRTTVRAEYFLNKQPIGLAELRSRLAGHPDAYVLIVWERDTGELRRLRAAIRASESES